MSRVEIFLLTHIIEEKNETSLKARGNLRALQRSKSPSICNEKYAQLSNTRFRNDGTRPPDGSVFI